MPAMSSGARARLSLAVRGFADTASEGLAGPWRGGIRSEAEVALGTLPDALDLALASTPLPSRGSWWWPIFTVVQWVALLAGLTGAGWLLAAAVLPTIGLPAIEIPRVEGWAVPTLLIVGAVLLGILLGLLSGLLGIAVGASHAGGVPVVVWSPPSRRSCSGASCCAGHRGARGGSGRSSRAGGRELLTGSVPAGELEDGMQRSVLSR